MKVNFNYRINSHNFTFKIKSGAKKIGKAFIKLGLAYAEASSPYAAYERAQKPKNGSKLDKIA